MSGEAHLSMWLKEKGLRIEMDGELKGMISWGLRELGEGVAAEW